jgi:cvfA/B/C family virulence factor
MAQLIIVYWHDIPAQVIVRLARQSAKRELSSRFQAAIDRAAMRSGEHGTDAYLAAWRRASPVPCGDDIEAEATSAAQRIEAEFDEARLAVLVNAGGRAT